jgi:hypothetical protein
VKLSKETSRIDVQKEKLSYATLRHAAAKADRPLLCPAAKEDAITPKRHAALVK